MVRKNYLRAVELFLVCTKARYRGGVASQSHASARTVRFILEAPYLGVLAELDHIFEFPLAKHRAHVLHVKLLREEGFCEWQGRDTSVLYAWPFQSWKPGFSSCLEA